MSQKLHIDELAVESPPKHPSHSMLRTVFIILTCSLASVLNTIALAGCNIALPDIGYDLDIQQDSLQWVTSAYALSSGCFLLLCGRLADLYGRKLVYLGGIAWMGAFALGCGFSQSENQLFILRGLQGIGSAACITAAIGILAQSFPPGPTRSMGFAIFSAGAPLGGALGFNVGGALVQYTTISWRGVFHLSAGLAALTFILGLFSINSDEPSTEKDKRVDWIGAAFVTLGLVLIMFVLGEGELAPQGWRTPYMIALLILGVFLMPTFLAWEYFLSRSGTTPPLLDIGIFTRAKGKFIAILLIIFLEWGAFMSWMLWVQLYYQEYKGYTPTQTMLRLIPTSVVGLAFTFIAGFIVALVPAVYLLGFGAIATGIACLLFAIINVHTSYWAYEFPSTFLTVAGADLIFPCGALFVSRVALPHEQSVAGGVFSTFAQLGTSFGLAITTIMYNSVSRKQASNLGDVPNAQGLNMLREAQLSGYRAAQWTGFGFAMCAFVLSVLLFRGVGVIGGRGKVKSLGDTVSVD